MERKYANIVELAQSKGSTATTNAGARRYLLAHLPKPHLLSRKNHNWNSSRWEWDRWTDTRMASRADGRARVLGYPAQSEQWAWYCEAYRARYNTQRGGIPSPPILTHGGNT